MNSIRGISDLESVNKEDALDLFDVVIRRDDNFIKYNNSEEVNTDEDFIMFTILCYSFSLIDLYKNKQQVITLNHETVNHDLDRIAELLDEPVYLKIIRYNKDGSIKGSMIFKCNFIVKENIISTSDVATKIFIFDVIM